MMTARKRCDVRLALAIVLGAAACGSAQDNELEAPQQRADDASGDTPQGDAERGAAGDAGVKTGEGTGGASAATYAWDLPAWVPLPPIPEDNPMTEAKVELGRRLFYDKRLSGNQTQSCASCHEQKKAFTDGRATGLGSTGQAHTRSPMSLVNAAYNMTLTWANITPVAFSLERQATVPLFGDTPVELGLTLGRDLAPRLSAVPLYNTLFAEAFPDEDEPINDHNVTRAIASFERTLISVRSAFDRWFFEGDERAISESAKRGYELFNGHPFECFHCHGGFNFSDQTTWAGVELPDSPPYHNTGLYNIDGKGGYPENNTGLFAVTGKPEDMGRFKVPTLRNIAVTAPYMHDGSIATLSEVLDHYSAGGRTIEDGPYAGDGSKNPFKSVFVPGFSMTEQERADMIAFLESLTDQAFLENPKFSNPWE